MPNNSLIQMLLSAEVDPQSITNIQAQLNQIQQNIKPININANVTGAQNIAGMTDALDKLENVTKKNLMLDLDRMANRYRNLIKQEDISKIKSMIATLSHTDPKLGYNIDLIKVKMKEVAVGAEQSRKALDLANKSAMSFGEAMKTAAYKFGIWSVITASYFKVIREISTGVKFITEMDSALTEIGMVQNKNRSQVAGLAKEYNNLAKEMRVLTTDISSSAVALYRQGLTQEEVMSKLRTATMYSKIANIELKESIDLLTATVNSMGVDVERAADVFLYLGDATATSGAEIGKGLSKVGGTAAALGVEFEKVASWISVISAKTRESAETIGHNIATILSRMSRLTITGFTEDDDTKINDVAKALNEVGIALTDQQGNFRNFGIVLDEVGSKWDSINSKQKALLAYTLAGVRQQSRFYNLMEGYAESMQLYEGSLEAAGTAQSKFNIYLESNQATLDKFRTTIQGLWLSIIDSDSLMSVIKMGTSFIQTLDDMVQKVGTVQTALGILIPLIGVKYVTSVVKATKATITQNLAHLAIGNSTISVANGFKLLIGQLLGVKTAATGATIAFTGLNIAAGLLNAALIGIPLILTAIATAEAKRKRETEELIQSTRQAIETNDANIKKLKELSSEYENIKSKIINQIELNEAEKSTLEELVKINPSLIKGYDERGEAIIDVTQNIKDMIEELERANEIEDIKLTQGGQDLFANAKKNVDSFIAKVNEADMNITRLHKDHMERGLAFSNYIEGLDTLKKKYEILTTRQKEHGELNEKESRQLNELTKEISKTEKELENLNKQKIVYGNKIKNESIEIQNALFAQARLNVSYKDLSSEMKSVVADYIRMMNIMDYSDWIDMQLAVDSFIEALNNKEFKEVSDKYTKLAKQFREGKIEAEKFDEELQDILATALKIKGIPEDVVTRFFKDSTGIEDFKEVLEEIEENIKSLSEMNLKELTDEFNNVTTAIKDYNRYLSEVNSVEGLSTKSKEEIINKYQQLLPYLDDEQALRLQLIDILRKEEETQREVYRNMLIQSEHFYNGKIKGNETLFNEMKKLYGKDVENWGSLAKAKLEIEASLIKSLGDYWGKYYDAITGTVRGLEGSHDYYALKETPEYKEFAKRRDLLNKLKAEVDKAVSDVAGSLASINLSGISTSKSSASASEQYKAIADQYERINQLLADNNNMLEMNKKYIDNAKESSEEQLELIQKENALLKERQVLIHDLNKQRRAEVSQLQADLSEVGFKFTGIGDNLRISNLGHIEGQTKEIEELFNRFQDLQLNLIPKTSQEWWDYQKAITENIEKIKSTIQSLIDELHALEQELTDFDISNKIADLNKQLDTAKFNHWIESIILGLERLNDKSELLSFKLSLFDEEDYENRANVIADLYQASQEKLQGYREEWNKLAKITPKNANEAQQLANAMKQVQQGMRDAFVATRDYHRQLEKLQVDAISNEFEKANKHLELQLSIIDHNIKQLQDGILPDFTLDMVIPIPDFSEIFDETKSENEKIYNEQVELEEQIRQLKKQSLAMQLQEAEAFYREEMNKLMQHYTELIDKIAAKEREIANLKKFLDEQQKEQLKASQKAIKLLIEEFNKAKEEAEKEHGKVIEDEKLEHYNRLLRDLGLEWLNPEYEAIDTHQLAVEYITNSHLLALQSSYSTAWSNIVSTVSSAVSSIMSMIAQANAAVASMGSGGGGGGAISVGTKTVKVNPDGKAPKGLSVGTVVETAGGDYKITKVKSDGSYESIKLYADGTEGHPGGKALVGEKGKEIAILPSGRAIILGKYGGELVDLPCGTHVVPHEETKEILKHTGDIDNKKIFKYEDGTIPKYAGGILGGLLGVGSTISKVVSNVVSSVGDAIKDTVEKTTKTVEKEIDYSYRNEKWEIPEGVGMMSTRDLHDYVTYKLDADREFKETGVWNKKYSEGAQALRDKYGITEDEYSYGDLSHVRANIIFGDFLHYGLTSDNPENVKKAIKIGAINDYWDMPDDDYGTIEPYSRKKRPERGIGGGFDFGGFAPSYETPKLPPTLNELIGIDKPDFLVEMSKEFKEGVGKYAEGIYELLGFEGWDKYLDDRKDTLEEIANLQQAYLDGTDEQITKEEILSKIDQQLLEDTRTQSWLKIDLLEQMKINVETYVDKLKDKYDELLESGNVELAKQVFDEYNKMLTQQMQIESQINQAIKQRYDMEFALMEKKLNYIDKFKQELNYQKSLIEILSPDNVLDVSNIQKEIVGHTGKQIDHMYTMLDQLKEQQSLLKVGSYEWNIIGGQIDSVIGKIRSANLELAKMAKSAFTGFAGAFKDNVLSLNPTPGDYQRPEDDSDKWLEGLEKELEIQKLMKFVEENKLELNEKQLAIINEQGKIRKKELDVVRKELELQQLLVKIENLRNQKTIQMLAKKEDGTWDFEYVADIDEIRRVEDQILDARLDVVHAEQSLSKELEDEAHKAAEAGAKAAQGAYDKRIEKFEEVLKNAEQRMYKSAEEFRSALEEIGLEFAEGWLDEAVDEYWTYFITTAEIFIKEALEKTQQALKHQSKIFASIGNEAGKAYTDGLLSTIDEIMAGEGNILQKQKAIIDVLSSEYVEFALAGNRAGISFIEGLINSMGTVDYQYNFNEIPDKIVTSLKQRLNDLEDTGQEAGKALLEGLLSSIDSIMNDGRIEDKLLAILHLLDKTNEYGTLGQALGNEFMQGLVNTITDIADEISGEGEGILSEAINTMINMLDNKLGDFAEKGDLQGIAYAEALKAKLIEALENAELTQQDIINLLSEFKNFDLAGLLSGEAYDESLTEGLIDAEENAEEKSSAIIKGLNDDVENFAEAGTAQGEAYKNAIVSAFENAVSTAKSIVGDLVSYINSQRFNVNVGVGGDIPNNIAGFDSGGYTGSFKGGKLALLHEKELILNKIDTSNLLKAVNITRDIFSNIKMPNFSNLQSAVATGGDQVFHIAKLEFPNVRDAREIEGAIKNLSTYATQWANRN